MSRTSETLAVISRGLLTTPVFVHRKKDLYVNVYVVESETEKKKPSKKPF